MKSLTSLAALGTASAAVALVLGAVIASLLNPGGDCGGEAVESPEVHEIRATKVVARPWLGKHQVYGIFMVPDRFKDNRKYTATMTVKGLDHEFAAALWPRRQHADDVSAQPGHYLLRSYVSTRLALWLLITGRFARVRRTCAWTLVFVERPS